MVIAAAGIAAAATIGAGAISASASSRASKRAASSQERAADIAAEEQARQFDATRSDLAPFREAGASAIQTLRALTVPGQQFDPARRFTLEDFQQDPGYAFRVQEGQRAIERSAAARGGLLGGGVLQALTRYGQAAGAQEYGSAFDRFQAEQANAFNRLASLAGTGYQATTTTGQLGAQAARDIGELRTQAGNARASGYIGSANALTQGISQGANAVSGLASYALLANRAQQPTTPTTNPQQVSIYNAYS